MTAPADRGTLACRVCGTTLNGSNALWRENAKGQPGIWSCSKHRGRRNCLVEGCRRTYAPAAGEFALEETVCGRHWRLLPERTRRVMRRIWRAARKYGWSDELVAREERLWALCKRKLSAQPIEAELARLAI